MKDDQAPLWPYLSGGWAGDREGCMTLGEAREHLGEGVIYRTADGKTDGVITSVGDRWVFVRYAGDQRSKATDPGMLRLLGTGASA